MEFLLKKIEQVLKIQKRWKTWQKIVAVLACFTVAVTTYALILPAITLNQETANEKGGIVLEESEDVAQVEAASGNDVQFGSEQTENAEAGASETAADAGQSEFQEASVLTGIIYPESLNVHAEKRKDADVLETVLQGTSVTILENQGDGWLYVSTPDGQSGFVKAAYVLLPGETVEDKKPAMTFEMVADKDSPDAEISEAYINGTFSKPITVHVEAPVGAFPAGTTMKVRPIAEEQVKEAVESVIPESETVKRVSAVDITFIDVCGDEIEPDTEIKVSLMSEDIPTDQESVVVHVDNEGQAQMVEAKTEEENVVFESDKFSVYVVVGTELIREITLPGRDDTYEVTVTYGPEAKIPKNVRLNISSLDSRSDEYLKAREAVIEAKKDKDEAFDESGFGFEALDISIVDEAGVSIEPAEGAEVKVNIKMKELPDAVDQSAVLNTMEIQHLNDRNGTFVIETVASSENITVADGDIEAEFVTDSFSTYTISWSNITEGGLNGIRISQTRNGSQYIIYAKDATDGGYYALKHDGTSVKVASADGVLTYTGNQNDLKWYVRNQNGSYDFYFGTNTSRRYLNAGTSGSRVSVDASDNTTWNVWSDFIYSAGDVFLQSYNAGTFRVRNVSGEGDWGSNSLVYFSAGFTQPVIDEKNVTVHYGYMNGDTFVEFDDLPEGAQTSYGAPEMIGDQLNVRYDIDGKDYVTTRINNPSNGTQISPLLQTEAGSAAYWKYRVQTTNGDITEWQTFGDNENDIYVIYRDTPTEKSYDDHGLDPEDLSAPATNKGVQSNGNGTYDVSLSVTGTSNSMTNKTHANVVIVLDTSSSMNGTDTGVSGKNRLDVAKEAIGSLADQLFGFNTSEDPAAIELAFVNFSHRVRNEQTMHSIYSGTSSAAFKSMINATSENGGTNYDTAIEAANSILWNDADPVYVIFVTDGDTVSRGYLEYDESGARDHASDWDGGTYYTGDTATYGNTYLERARSAAKLQVDKILANPNNKFYSIGVFGNVQYLEALGGTYLGQADEQNKIEEAFARIIDEISLDLGYKDVTIHDGITAMTSTTLVNGNVDQFRYEITEKDGTKKVYANGAALRTDYPGIGLAEYDSSEKAVKWALGDEYQLADGVTYKVIFTVWPSQEAYDLLAELNNGTKDYDGLADDVKSQIVIEEGKYYLKTNTDAKVDYTSFKTEGGQVVDTTTVVGAEIKDPKGKMILDGTMLQMKKEWNDSLDRAQLLELLTTYLNEDKTDTTYTVTLRLWQDKDTSSEKEIATGAYQNGFIYKPSVTITDGEVTAVTWPAIDVAIAPGVLVTITDENAGIYNDTTRYPRITYGNITYAMLETGHDYDITEDNIDLHFELNTDTYHPMVVDGKLKTVKFSSDGSSITEMSADNTELSTLTATNDLKGGLEVRKYVTTKDDMSDTVTSDTAFFTFKIKLQKSATDDTPVYTTEDQFDQDGSTILGSLGFRIFAPVDIPEEAANVADDKSSYEYNGNTFRANYNDNNEITGYTARGTVPSGGEITLKIRQSDTIRVVNIPAGSYYTVEEVENEVPDDYELINSSNVSNSVPANTQALAEFWNKRSSFTIDLLKVDELYRDKVLADAEFSLYQEDGVTPATDADGQSIGAIKTVEDGKAVIGKLLPGVYKLVETVSPKGYNLMTTPVTIIVTTDKVTYQQGNREPADAVRSSDGLTWTITATNTTGEELPHTGGSGTLPYTLGGIALIMASALMYGFRMRRRERRFN